MEPRPEALIRGRRLARGGAAMHLPNDDGLMIQVLNQFGVQVVGDSVRWITGCESCLSGRACTFVADAAVLGTSPSQGQVFTAIVPDKSFLGVEVAPFGALGERRPAGVSSLPQAMKKNIEEADGTRVVELRYGQETLVAKVMLLQPPPEGVPGLQLRDLDVEVFLADRLRQRGLLHYVGFACYPRAGNETWWILRMRQYEGDLREHLGRVAPGCKAAVDLAQAASIGLSVSTSLACMHEVLFPHLDIKPANVLVNAVPIVGARGAGALADIHLADFGVSSQWLRGRDYHVGTAGYRAPEQAIHRWLSVQTDIVCFGLLMWEVLTGVELGNRQELADRVMQGEVDIATSHASEGSAFCKAKVHRQLRWTTEGRRLWDFLRTCWVANPADRPRAEDCRQFFWTLCEDLSRVQDILVEPLLPSEGEIGELVCCLGLRERDVEFWRFEEAVRDFCKSGAWQESMDLFQSFSTRQFGENVHDAMLESYHLKRRSGEPILRVSTWKQHFYGQGHEREPDNDLEEMAVTATKLTQLLKKFYARLRAAVGADIEETIVDLQDAADHIGYCDLMYELCNADLQLLPVDERKGLLALLPDTGAGTGPLPVAPREPEVDTTSVASSHGSYSPGDGAGSSSGPLSHEIAVESHVRVVKRRRVREDVSSEWVRVQVPRVPRQRRRASSEESTTASPGPEARRKAGPVAEAVEEKPTTRGTVPADQLVAGGAPGDATTGGRKCVDGSALAGAMGAHALGLMYLADPAQHNAGPSLPHVDWGWCARGSERLRVSIASSLARDLRVSGERVAVVMGLHGEVREAGRVAGDPVRDLVKACVAAQCELQGVERLPWAEADEAKLAAVLGVAAQVVEDDGPAVAQLARDVCRQRLVSVDEAWEVLLLQRLRAMSSEGCVAWVVATCSTDECVGMAWVMAAVRRAVPAVRVIVVVRSAEDATLVLECPGLPAGSTYVFPPFDLAEADLQALTLSATRSPNPQQKVVLAGLIHASNGAHSIAYPAVLHKLACSALTAGGFLQRPMKRIPQTAVELQEAYLEDERRALLEEPGPEAGQALWRDMCLRTVLRSCTKDVADTLRDHVKALDRFPVVAVIASLTTSLDRLVAGGEGGEGARLRDYARATLQMCLGLEDAGSGDLGGRLDSAARALYRGLLLLSEASWKGSVTTQGSPAVEELMQVLAALQIGTAGSGAEAQHSDVPVPARKLPEFLSLTTREGVSGPNAWLEATVASGNIRRMLLASQAAAVRVLFIQDGWAEPAMCEVLAAAGLMRFVGYREALDRDRRRVVLLVALEYDTTLEQHFSEEAGCPVARSLHEAVAVSLAVATSLTALHGSEAVHGDVRPATVAVNYRDPGAGEGGRDLADVHLVPFAATKDGRAVERRPGAGTPYRAPEAAAGGNPTAAADMYGFGALMLRLVTGALPSERSLGEVEDLTELQSPTGKHAIYEAMQGPDGRNLLALVRRCLAADPMQRPMAAECAEYLTRLRGRTSGTGEQATATLTKPSLLVPQTKRDLSADLATGEIELAKRLLHEDTGAGEGAIESEPRGQDTATAFSLGVLFGSMTQAMPGLLPLFALAARVLVGAQQGGGRSRSWRHMGRVVEVLLGALHASQNSLPGKLDAVVSIQGLLQQALSLLEGLEDPLVAEEQPAAGASEEEQPLLRISTEIVAEAEGLVNTSHHVPCKRAIASLRTQLDSGSLFEVDDLALKRQTAGRPSRQEDKRAPTRDDLKRVIYNTDARVFWSEYCLPKELVPSREFVTYLADHLECEFGLRQLADGIRSNTEAQQRLLRALTGNRAGEEVRMLDLNRLFGVEVSFVATLRSVIRTVRVPDSLPQLPGLLVRRPALEGRVVSQLAGADCETVTFLTGAPDTGKSTLALVAAHQLRDAGHCPGGAHLCTLKGFRTGADVLRKIGADLGFVLSAGAGDADRAGDDEDADAGGSAGTGAPGASTLELAGNLHLLVAEHCAAAGGPVLLVLDKVEGPEPGQDAPVDAIMEALAGVPDLRLLITAGAAVAERAKTPAKWPGVRVERVSVGPFDEEDVLAYVRACMEWHLELAEIQLQNTHMRGSSVQALLSFLEQLQSPKTQGAGEGPCANVADQLNRLPARLQRALESLALFPGSFPADAIGAVGLCSLTDFRQATNVGIVSHDSHGGRFTLSSAARDELRKHSPTPGALGRFLSFAADTVHEAHRLYLTGSYMAALTLMDAQSDVLSRALAIVCDTTATVSDVGMEALVRALGSVVVSDVLDMRLQGHEPAARVALAWASRTRPGTACECLALAWHALALAAQMRTQDALPLYERAAGLLGPGTAEGSEDDLLRVAAVLLGHLRCLSELGRHQDSFAVVQDLQRRLEATPAPQRGRIHTCLVLLVRGKAASSMKMLQDLKGARAAYEEVLEELTKQLGASHPRVGNVLGELAKVYHDLGDSALAVKMQERAHQVQRKAFGESHSRTLTSWGSLASHLRDCGRLDEALRIAMEVHRRLRESFGEDFSRTANALALVARCYMRDGKYKEALAAYNDVIANFETTFGPKHSRTCNAVMNKATCLREIGARESSVEMLQEAVQVYQQALEGMESLGSQHSRVGMVLSNMGKCYQYLRQHIQRSTTKPTTDEEREQARQNRERAREYRERARQCHERARDINEHVFGPDHFRTLSAACDIATCCDDLDTARGMFLDALRGYEKQPPLREEAFANLYRNLAYKCQEFQERGEAAKWFLKEHEVHERRDPQGTMAAKALFRAALALLQDAKALSRAQRHAKARERAEQAMALFQRLPDDQSTNVGDCHHLIEQANAALAQQASSSTMP